MKHIASVVVAMTSWVTAAEAQQDAANVGAKLMHDAAVKAAVEGLRASEPQTLEDQIRLCEVEAPPFKESKRAQVYAQMFKHIGLANVRIDKESDVLSEKRGMQAKPHLAGRSGRFARR
jgi:tripeptide aminopeptidase